MSNEILDLFGRLLMENVRDLTIEELDKNFKGQGNDVITKKVQLILKTEELEINEKFLKIIPLAVDTTIHYFLWMLENEKQMKISLETLFGITTDINKVSDGLSGELYGSKGWIARFSKERLDEIIS